jgi:hypothetical protein
LRQIAEDGASKWHTRAAAVLSLVQMAQMDHCRRGNGRSDTVQWLLAMLTPDQNEDIRFALVSGLGTLLKGVEQTETTDGIMLVAAKDEPLLLSAMKRSGNGVVVEAVTDLKAYSDGLIDWVLNESSLIAEGVWPMRHLLHVFCIKTATSGNQGRAEKLGQQLFGRVHAMLEDVFEKEQGDVLKGLDMMCPAMRDDKLPLFLPLLQSGEAKQRSRVMQVAAELGMQFVSKSCESLYTLAQALLSPTWLAGLIEFDTLLEALLRDQSNCKVEILLEYNKVFRYIMNSLKPSADQGLEAPKRVVEFLVEFEKNHLSSADDIWEKARPALLRNRGVMASEEEIHKNLLEESATAAAGNRNETKPIEKSQETNPKEKWKEDKKHSIDLSLERLAAAVEDSGLLQERTSEGIADRLSLSEAMPEEKRTEDQKHSEDLSLESLAAAVEDFKPRDLRTRIRQPEKPLNLYCAARLWATSGLMQERTSEEIAAWLSLSESMAKEAEDAFSNLQALKEPWVSGHGCNGGRRLQHVLEGMQDETQCLGRFMFSTFVEYIRELQMKDMSGSGIEEIEEQVKEWQPSGARGQLEQQLLLKEVRIGRRSQELPSWTGVVSAINNLAQIKSEISGKTERTLQRLRARNCTVEDVAGSIHEIYMAAMDLGNTAIFKHSEHCIASILQDCRGKSGMGLAELGTVLERDLPAGSEIVANMPQFVELNRLAFPEMTFSKTPEGTVQEVAKLNNLSESHARTLLELVKQVFEEYDNILKSRSFHYDLPTIVRNIKSQFEAHRKIPALIGGVFAVWSLESKTEKCPVPRRPLPAQVVAIVRLLALDDQNALDKIRKMLSVDISSVLDGWCKLAGRKSTSDGESRIDSSHLAQIKTGQGKSIVLGTLATVLSIAGFSVDCVCYSAYLSGRDQLDFQAIFDLFDVSHMVQYGTFQKLSERLVNSEGDVREMTRGLIMSSKKGPDASTSKPSGAKGGQKKRILLVDEVDVFFSRSFYGETYDAVEHLKMSEITELQKKAWSMRGDTELILPALECMDAYKALMNKFPPDVKDLLEGQINIMIRDLEAWKNGDSTALFRAYKIMDEKVAYKSGVCYNTKNTFGYLTLWTYFHEFECKRVPETALEDHLGLMIKCGQFSYAEIPKHYNLMLGVTGTLVPEGKGGPHPLGTFEQEIIRDDYNITGKTELPSVYGERNLTFYENEHVQVQKDEDSYNCAISLEVAKALEGRAVLVFFESEAKLEEWQDSAYGQRVPVGTMQCIKSDTRNITMKVRKATRAGQVTLLSREHGRGLDFRCFDMKVEELGGLHVVQTFLSEELSEEIQIRGRTARQKTKGSFQMILLAKDLEKFEISNDEIEQKEKGLYVPVNTVASPAAERATSGVTKQTMYKFLHAKRAVFLDKSSATRRETVYNSKALHDQSSAYQQDLLGFCHASTQSSKAIFFDKCLKYLLEHN